MSRIVAKYFQSFGMGTRVGHAMNSKQTHNRVTIVILIFLCSVVFVSLMIMYISVEAFTCFNDQIICLQRYGSNLGAIFASAMCNGT